MSFFASQGYSRKTGSDLSIRGNLDKSNSFERPTTFNQ